MLAIYFQHGAGVLVALDYIYYLKDMSGKMRQQVCKYLLVNLVVAYVQHKFPMAMYFVT